ncbi:MAG: ABC transporter permease [Candidatus Hodarchaeales archaeon]
MVAKDYGQQELSKNQNFLNRFIYRYINDFKRLKFELGTGPTIFISFVFLFFSVFLLIPIGTILFWSLTQTGNVFEAFKGLIDALTGNSPQDFLFKPFFDIFSDNGIWGGGFTQRLEESAVVSPARQAFAGYLIFGAFTFFIITILYYLIIKPRFVPEEALWGRILGILLIIVSVLITLSFIGAFWYELRMIFAEPIITGPNKALWGTKWIIQGPDLGALPNSVLVALSTTVLSSLFGIFFAFIMARYTFATKNFFRPLLLLPLIIPPFVSIIGFQSILGENGILNEFLFQLINQKIVLGGSVGIVFVQFLHFYTLVYLNVYSSLVNIDPSLEECAENLGAKGLKLTRTITLPLAMPGIAAGSVLAFILAIEDIGTPLIFNEIQTGDTFFYMPTLIFADIINYTAYTKLGYTVIAKYAALAAILVIIAIIGFLLIRRFVSLKHYAMISKGRVGEPRTSPASRKMTIFLIAILSIFIPIALIPHLGTILFAISESGFIYFIILLIWIAILSATIIYFIKRKRDDYSNLGKEFFIISGLGLVSTIIIPLLFNQNIRVRIFNTSNIDLSNILNNLTQSTVLVPAIILLFLFIIVMYSHIFLVDRQENLSQTFKLSWKQKTALSLFVIFGILTILNFVFPGYNETLFDNLFMKAMMSLFFLSFLVVAIISLIVLGYSLIKLNKLRSIIALTITTVSSFIFLIYYNEPLAINQIFSDLTPIFSILLMLVSFVYYGKILIERKSERTQLLGWLLIVFCLIIAMTMILDKFRVSEPILDTILFLFVLISWIFLIGLGFYYYQNGDYSRLKKLGWAIVVLSIVIILSYLRLVYVLYILPPIESTEFTGLIRFLSYLEIGHTPDASGISLREEFFITIWNMFLYSFIATIIIVILATITSYFISRKNFPGKNILDTIVTMPLAIPGIIIGFGYFIMFYGQTFPSNLSDFISNPLSIFLAPFNPENNPIFLLIVSYTVRKFTFTMRAAFAGMQQVDVQLEEASFNLGASRVQTIWKITVPMIAISVFAGGMISLVYCMSEVSTTIILLESTYNPGNFGTATWKIWQISKDPNIGLGLPMAAMLGIILMIIQAISIVVTNVILKSRSEALTGI